MNLIINQYELIVNTFSVKVVVCFIEMAVMTEIKDRLKFLRKNLGLRQQDMANSLNVPFTAISKYELGIIKPSSEILARIANTYDVNLNWLLTGSGGMFIHAEVIAMTGTYGHPHLRLIKTDSNIKVQNLAESDVSDDDIENLESTDSLNSDEQMTKLAQKLQKPLTIEYFEKGIKNTTKIFYPDGSIESVLAEIERKEIYIENLKQKIEDLADNKDKLEFVELAINTFESADALKQLKLLIKGMELAKKSDFTDKN
jgi:DNA-binding XRE family transcriptional regulator